MAEPRIDVDGLPLGVAGTFDTVVGVDGATGAARRFPFPSMEGGMRGYATKAALDADLAHDAGSLAFVTNDPTPANNGTYRKTGASGSGSWVQSADRVSGLEGRTVRVEQFIGSPLSDIAGANYDIFSRADGAIGTATSGQAWEVVSGTVTISDGKAAGTTGRAVINSGSADADVTVDFEPVSTGVPAINMRLVDASNYLYVQVTSTGLRLGKVVAGVASLLENPGGAINTAGNMRVRAVMVGKAVEVYRDGVLNITHTLSDADYAIFGAATKHGFYVHGAGRVSFFMLRSPDEAKAIATQVEDRLDTLSSWLPHVLGPDIAAYDGFNRPDGPIGTADSGQAWQVLAGTMSIVGGKLVGVNGLAVLDRGQADADVTAYFDVPSTTGTAELIFRGIDATNYMFVSFTTDQVRLQKRVAGTITALSLATVTGVGLAPVTLRVVTNRASVKVYTDGVLRIEHTLSADDLSMFGDATKHGFAMRTTARASRFVQRSVASDSSGAVARAHAGIRAQISRDVHQMTFHAAQNHTASATCLISDFGLPFPGGGVTQFRGAVAAADGVVYCITRDSGFFVLFEMDGTPVQTTLGLSPGQISGMNVSGGTLAPDGRIYCPPRDSGEVLIIDPRTRTATLTDFGIDLSPATEDKWTGAVLGPDGLIYCLPTSAQDILIIDPVAQTARRTNYGLSWSGGKSFAGGGLGPDGKIYLPPYNNQVNAKGVMVIDPLAQTASFEYFGLDLSGTGMWSGTVTGSEGLIYCCPRNADAILIIDPFKQTARKETFGLTIPAGGNKWTRFVTGPDGKLYATPADRTDILVVDPIAQSAVLTDLGTTIPATSQKYIGGVLSPNGKIYCTPDQATNMLVIDVAAPPLPANLTLGPLLNKSP